MRSSVRIMLLAPVALLATVLCAPPASASWASEDDGGELAQVDAADYVCHDGIDFDWADDQVLYSNYRAGRYNPTTELSKETAQENAGLLTTYLLNKATGTTIVSGNAYVPWNPSQITSYTSTPDTLDGLPAIHLLEGHLSWTFPSWQPTGEQVRLTRSTDPNYPYHFDWHVDDCYRHADVTVGRRGAGTIQVVMHGTKQLSVTALNAATFRIEFANGLLLSDETPSSHTVQRVDTDLWPDLVLTFAATSTQTPVLLSGQTAGNGLLQGTVH